MSSVRPSTPIPATESRCSSWARRRFTPALLAILALATLVRIPTLGVHDLWIDEFHSLLNSAAHRGADSALPDNKLLYHVPHYTDLAADSSALAVWRGLRDDTHPPAFFVLLYGWRRLSGDGAFALRLPAAVFSVLSIVPVALILRRCGHPLSALAAALLLALACAHIFMGQMARQYSLAMLLVGAAYWLLLVMEQRWTRFTRLGKFACTATYTLTLCLAALTHYFTVLALLGQGVYVLLRFRKSLLASWIAGTAAAAGLFAALWLPSLLAQRPIISAQKFLFVGGEHHVGYTLLRAADLPVRLLFQYPQYLWSTPEARAVAAVGALALVMIVVALWRARTPGVLLFGLWYATPCLALIILDLATGSELLAHVRYPSLLVPPLAALVVLAAARLQPPTPILVAAAMGLVIAATLRPPVTPDPQGRAAARVVAEHIHDGDLLVFDAIGWHANWARGEYVQVSHYLPPADYPVVFLSAPPDPALRAQMRTFDNIFVVSPRMEVLPNYTPDVHQPVASWGYFTDIGMVHRLRRRPRACAATARPNGPPRRGCWPPADPLA